MAVELIAEVSSNHGGDLSLAKEFIHRFAEAGADWVKFQTTRVKHLRKDDPQYAWFQQAELSDEAHFELKAECEKAGTRFLTTVYHADEVPFLRNELGLTTIKIGSGEARERALRDAVKVFSRVIVGCGLNPGRWTSAVDNLACVTRYPAPHGMVPQHFSHFDEYIGWSDHCVGLESCRVAILRGATIIEKHVRLEPSGRFPTMRARKPFEATVDEFKALRAFADEDPTRFLGRWQAA